MDNQNNAQKPDWLMEVDEYPYQPNFDIDKLYDAANEEMALQQRKRDQIITLYMAMITFLVPFTIGLAVASLVKGLMFLFLSVIGLILGLIMIRYRVYKEVYWVSIRTLARLKNSPKESVDKRLIQSVFYSSLKKVGGKFADKEKKKINLKKLAKESFFSSETLYFVLQAFVSSAIFTVSFIFILDFAHPAIRYTASALVGMALFGLQYYKYIKELARTYLSLADEENKRAYNYAFSKAWHLHFYKSNSK